MKKFLILNFEGLLIKDNNDNSSFYEIAYNKYKLEFKDISMEKFNNIIIKSDNEIKELIKSSVIEMREIKEKFCDSFEWLNKLKSKYELILISRQKKDTTFNFLKKFNINFFKKVYLIKAMPFGDYIKVFDDIKNDFNLGAINYLIGDSMLSFPLDKIRSFTKKLEIDSKYKIFNKKINPKNNLISFDLDGVFNEAFTHEVMNHKEIKLLLEEYLNISLTNLEFVLEWKKLSKEEKIQLRKKSYYKMSKTTEVSLPYMIDYIKKISRNNELVIFSVTSKKRIENFLQKNNLKKYFAKIYSGQEDFGIRTKRDYMFKKIKKDFPNKKGYIHLGDLYEIDYLEAKKAGFESYIVDNSPFERVTVNELLY